MTTTPKFFTYCLSVSRISAIIRDLVLCIFSSDDFTRLAPFGCFTIAPIIVSQGKSEVGAVKELSPELLAYSWISRSPSSDETVICKFLEARVSSVLVSRNLQTVNIEEKRSGCFFPTPDYKTKLIQFNLPSLTTPDRRRTQRKKYFCKNNKVVPRNDILG